MAMVYDITNDTVANEGNRAIIQPYTGGNIKAFKLSLAAINYKYGGGKYTFIVKSATTDAGWVSFILTDPKQSTFDPGVTFLYYTVGGYEYNNNPDHDAEVIKPYASTEDSILPYVLGDDNWNGTAFTNGVKALLIKEWSI